MSQAKQPAIVIDVDDEKPRAPAAEVTVDEMPLAVANEDADLNGGLPRRAVTNEDGSITLPLRQPVTMTIRSNSSGTRTETFDQLTFHRLRGSDIRTIQAASKDRQGEVILARSARISEPVMNVLYDRLDAADIADGAQIVAAFLGSGRTNPA